MDMFTNTVSLFVKGKLFRDLNEVIRKALIGVAVTVVCMVLLRKVGLPLWAAVSLASLIGGALQPYLFKDLKYA